MWHREYRRRRPDAPGGRLPARRRLAGAAGVVAVAALSLTACAPTWAQTFDVPDGFVVEEGPPAQEQDNLLPTLEIRPDNGPFSDLSRMILYRVTTPVEDPADWLREQVAFSVMEPDAEPESWFESPDSPFGDSAFSFLEDVIPGLVERMRSLGDLPLEACDDPVPAENAVGAYHRLDCAWSIGPLHKYRQLRLQEVEGTWYLTRIETMNERRLRHFDAIANSFGR